MAELLQQQPPRPDDADNPMPYFMVPRYLELADELPKTPTQKVHKHVLRRSTAR